MPYCIKLIVEKISITHLDLWLRVRIDNLGAANSSDGIKLENVNQRLIYLYYSCVAYNYNNNDFRCGAPSNRLVMRYARRLEYYVFQNDIYVIFCMWRFIVRHCRVTCHILIGTYDVCLYFVLQVLTRYYKLTKLSRCVMNMPIAYIISSFFFQFKNHEQVETVHHNTATRSCIVCAYNTFNTHNTYILWLVCIYYDICRYKVRFGRRANISGNKMVFKDIIKKSNLDKTCTMIEEEWKLWSWLVRLNKNILPNFSQFLRYYNMFTLNG